MFGQQKAIETSEDGLTIQSGRSNPPEFPRTYSVQLTPEVYMEITAKDYGIDLGRYLNGELHQRNGSMVWFNPANPEDKILDRELLPLVQKWCKRILQIDRKAFRPPPSEFTDDTGQKWRRA